jgi:serine/threonine protein kinase
MDNFEVIEDIGIGKKLLSIKLILLGSFGRVSKVKRKSDGQVMVWKELNYGKMNEKEKKQLVAEVNILRELRHPNIV